MNLVVISQGDAGICGICHFQGDSNKRIRDGSTRGEGLAKKYQKKVDSICFPLVQIRVYPSLPRFLCTFEILQVNLCFFV